jgi:hypothetical protein
LVLTPTGYRKIEELKAGDVVLSRDQNDPNSEVTPHHIAQTFIRKAESIFHITYKNGLELETTWNHPFYIKGKGWTQAKDLREGDFSLTEKDNETLQIISVTEERRGEETTVYNFEVEGEHTYFVGGKEPIAGDPAVWVHNADYLAKVWTVVKIATKATLTYFGVKGYEESGESILDASKQNQADVKNLTNANKEYNSAVDEAMNNLGDVDSAGKAAQAAKVKVDAMIKAVQSTRTLSQALSEGIPETSLPGPAPTSMSNIRENGVIYLIDPYGSGNNQPPANTSGGATQSQPTSGNTQNQTTSGQSNNHVSEEMMYWILDLVGGGSK